MPDIGFTINGRPIPEVSKYFRSFQNTFTFTASSEHHLERIECTASNTVGEAKVEQVIVVDGEEKLKPYKMYNTMLFKEPPSSVKISGPKHIEKGTMVCFHPTFNLKQSS